MHWPAFYLPSGRRNLLVRAGVSLVLLSLLAWKIPWRTVWQVSQEVRGSWLVVAELLAGLQLLLGAWRWKKLLEVQRIFLSFRASFRITLLGQCFNLLLPGSSGGDIVRFVVVQSFRRRARLAVALSLIYDRLLGTIATGLSAPILAIFLPWKTIPLSTRPLWALALGTASLLGVAGLFLLFLPHSVRFRNDRCGHRRSPFWTRFWATLRRYRSCRKICWLGLGLSLLIQWGGILLYGALARGLGVGLPLLVLGVVISLATSLCSLPISIGGLGIREASLVFLLAPLGIAAPVALAFSLASFGVFAFWGTIGGILFLFPPRGPLPTRPKTRGKPVPASAPLVGEKSPTLALPPSPSCPGELPKERETGSFTNMGEATQAWEIGKKIVARLVKAGFTAYFAGGCVRDQLLGRFPKDIDIATDARPEEVQKLFPKTTGLEGKCFGVVRVLEEGHTFEVATFREDLGYEDGRRPVSVRFATAQADALRRDFTINGLFYDPLREKVIDFVGGQADLHNRLIRAIGDPRARFSEDHLRLLRAIRLAANLGFDIENATWLAIREQAAAIKNIAPERIREELDRIWTGPEPARGLRLLDESGLLVHILPEVAALHGVEQPPQYHPEGDVFEHVCLMLSHLRQAPLELTLACLFHDIGKPLTARRDENGRIRFNEHETVGARLTADILRRLRYSREITEKVSSIVANHMTFKDVPHMRLSTLKKLMARPTFALELELHRIDCLSSHGDLSIYEFLIQKQSELSQSEIEPPRLITGWDLQAMGIPAGKELGRILAEIREAQLEGKIKDRSQALALAKELVGKTGGPIQS